MLTLDGLRNFGADVDTGLKRCVNKESFYFRLIKTVPGNADFVKLKEAIENKDYEAGFLSAHALKGVTTNLSLDSLSKPIIEITDHLRFKEEMDYKPLLDEIEKKRSELADLCAE